MIMVNQFNNEELLKLILKSSILVSDRTIFYNVNTKVIILLSGR